MPRHRHVLSSGIACAAIAGCLLAAVPGTAPAQVRKQADQLQEQKFKKAAQERAAAEREQARREAATQQAGRRAGPGSPAHGQNQGQDQGSKN